MKISKYCVQLFFRVRFVKLIGLRTFAVKFLVIALLTDLTSMAAAQSNSASNQLLGLSLEELMDIKVTTVSRRPQKLSEVASAVFVITQDDIRRSGATNIPDALRMAPGVQVDRLGTDKWAVSIRGFTGRFANKLQVLIDGRSVYNPVFSGTLWEQQDTLMEDIERIEVIRGPAATVWGINAVNGVINIITKKAADTQGTLLTAGGGSFEQGFAGVRYGGKLNEDTPFRLYAKGFARHHTDAPSNASNRDQWQSARGGFRIDHHRGNDQFTLQGDIFSNAIGDTYDKSVISLPSSPANNVRGQNEGGNIRFRWDRTLSEQSSILLQTYYDRVRYQISPIFSFDTESFDIDAQHRFSLWERHNITWGGNYRLYHSKVFDNGFIKLTPEDRTNHVYSGFLRDDITLIPDRLYFNLGTRLDHNDFTGLEIQPSARLAWTPNTENTLWLSISRAVRTPARAENDATLDFLQFNNVPGLSLLPFPFKAVFHGSHSFQSEKLLAYETGYRHRFSPQASVDIAGFVNDYSELRDFSLGGFSLSTGLPRQIITSVLTDNSASALTYGFELSGDWKPTQKWRLQGNYSFIDMRISSSSLTKDFDSSVSGADTVTPQHRISLRSNYDLSDKLDVNLWLRYISDIAYYNLPGYVTADAKVSYRPAKNIELFAVGQNLFSRNHQELVPDFIPSIPSVIPRGVYGGIQIRF
ncbi:iron complex outermembrane receptor protein [Nitrosomonas oligotropha]|uniref:Iron complex outermembrane receptor protein n=1 Tax=Nitrosomonas oligotropha TaxID=42354 RepID=A0A2T5HYE6_9PROT|nr:iron complex outermembrane receptor protein [Nitrosomonas oligotropha]